MLSSVSKMHKMQIQKYSNKNIYMARV